MTDDKDSAVLLPCPVPWCGGHATFNNNDYQIECDACELTSYGCDTEAEAITAWNTRQLTQSDALTDQEITHAARAICVEQSSKQDNGDWQIYASGGWDHTIWMRLVEEGIRKGMELSK